MCTNGCTTVAWFTKLCGCRWKKKKCDRRFCLPISRDSKTLRDPVEDPIRKAGTVLVRQKSLIHSESRLSVFLTSIVVNKPTASHTNDLSWTKDSRSTWTFCENSSARAAFFGPSRSICKEKGWLWEEMISSKITYDTHSLVCSSSDLLRDGVLLRWPYERLNFLSTGGM